MATFDRGLQILKQLKLVARTGSIGLNLVDFETCRKKCDHRLNLYNLSMQIFAVTTGVYVMMSITIIRICIAVAMSL